VVGGSVIHYDNEIKFELGKKSSGRVYLRS